MSEKPIDTSDERCDPILHARGDTLMVLAVSKTCAQQIVEALRADAVRDAEKYDRSSLWLYDWHFVGGRAVFKTMTRGRYDAEAAVK